MRSRFWVVLDTSMLLVFVVLQAWRLTGVILHEWLAVALIGGLLVHLLSHWSWVETRSKRIRTPRSGRTRFNFALNLTLFIAATAAIFSGFMISKVVLPLHPAPAEFLKWHSIHDVSAQTALVCVGLHLGLNWGLMVAALRNLVNRRAPRRPALGLRSLLAAFAIIVMAIAILGGGLWAVERFIPAGEVTMILPNGHRVEHAPPPPDIARLRSDERAPAARGLPKFLLQGVVVAASSMVGRKVLRLRLD